MTISVDFDDTIMNTKNVLQGYRMGQPEPGAIASVNRLYNEGHTIIIFTARDVSQPTAYKAVADWLEYFHIPYHMITNIKQHSTDVYIDDKAIHYDTWGSTLARLTKLQNRPTISS